MSPLRYLPAWPRIQSNASDVERSVHAILDQMTLAEKIGQMIQPELDQLTPEDVRTYKIGSALNGAGIWPGGKRHADVSDWVGTIDAFWTAADEAYQGRPFRIPFLWATDAVHGHNNVFGATVFPHNIGLGATGDVELIRRIGAATAREIVATGMDWTFAPTVTTPRDRRWGRYFEGYSEDPEIVHAFADAMVQGLQGLPGEERTDRVVATLKHWIGDGGTANGVDRGVTRCSEDLLRNIHGIGFLGGIEAGAGAVMVSFSSWEHPVNYDHSPGVGPPYNHKVHGSRYLLTDVLKDQIGFDGIVISDWDAHGEVAGCTLRDANYAINAGIDVLMVAESAVWQEVYRNAVAGVNDGRIPLSRIDDAVARVLRVKMRMGMWARPRPALRLSEAQRTVLGCDEHRALSREAARKSLVLLKNTGDVLPIAPTSRVLVTGSGADDIQKQTGGWTLTWQGDDVTLDDLPGAQTIAMAVRDVVGGERCTVDPWLETTDGTGHDVAVVVIGEDAYAEMRGTIKPWRTLEYAALKQSYARDGETLRRLRQAGIPVVTVLLTGRPLYVTEEINLSDAFVVAWLPGPEGGGVTDVLFAGPDGRARHDFQGQLPNSWPRRRRSMAVNRVPLHVPDYVVPAEEDAPSGEHEPLFPFGFGLSLRDGSTPGGELPVDDPEAAPPLLPLGLPLAVLGTDSDSVFRFRIGGHNTWSRLDVSREAPTETLIARTEPVAGPDGGPALSLRFHGYPAFIYAQAVDGEPRDLRAYAAAGGALAFDVRVRQQTDMPLLLACHDDYPAQPGLDLAPRLTELPADSWHTVRIPLAELQALGMDLRHVDVPFMLYTEGRASVEIAAVRWTTGP